MIRAWRAYRALGPLWAALYEAHPAIALASPGDRAHRAGRAGRGRCSSRSTGG